MLPLVVFIVMIRSVLIVMMKVRISILINYKCFAVNMDDNNLDLNNDDNDTNLDLNNDDNDTNDGDNECH